MARFPIKAFVSNGYYCINSSMVEIQLSDCGEAARYRITTFNYFGEKTVYYGYWQPISTDKRGRQFIRDWHNYLNLSPKSHKRLYLDNFLLK